MITRVTKLANKTCKYFDSMKHASEGPGNNFTHVTLDDPFAALLDNELSLSLSPAKLSHPENGFT